MRRLLVFGALGLAVTSAAACLVSVDESLVDGDGDGDASTMDPDAASANDSGTLPDDDATANPIDGGVDGAKAIDRGCVGFALGNYCGRSLARYTGNAQDLVRCLGDGGMGPVVPCSAGCAVMPAGRRDICNPCTGVPNGSYCVQQLVSDYNATDVRVTCSANAIATSGSSAPKICPSGCADAGSFGDCL